MPTTEFPVNIQKSSLSATNSFDEVPSSGRSSSGGNFTPNLYLANAVVTGFHQIRHDPASVALNTSSGGGHLTGNRLLTVSTSSGSTSTSTNGSTSTSRKSKHYKGSTDYAFAVQVTWSDGDIRYIRRTYADFLDFQQNIMQAFRNYFCQQLSKSAQRLPVLPAHRWYQRSTLQLAEHRECLLDNWIKALFKLPSYVSASDLVQAFFESQPADPVPDQYSRHLGGGDNLHPCDNSFVTPSEDGSCGYFFDDEFDDIGGLSFTNSHSKPSFFYSCDDLADLIKNQPLFPDEADEFTTTQHIPRNGVTSSSKSATPSPVSPNDVDDVFMRSKPMRASKRFTKKQSSSHRRRNSLDGSSSSGLELSEGLTANLTTVFKSTRLAAHGRSFRHGKSSRQNRSVDKDTKPLDLSRLLPLSTSQQVSSSGADTSNERVSMTDDSVVKDVDDVTHSNAAVVKAVNQETGECLSEDSSGSLPDESKDRTTEKLESSLQNIMTKVRTQNADSKQKYTLGWLDKTACSL